MSTPDSHRPWFVFAGGGTGGHLCPALAIAHALRQLDDRVDISFLCTDRPIDRRILGEAGMEAIPQGVRPFSTRPWRWPGFLMAWRRAIARCRSLFRERRPAAVVGAGGYGSDPPVRAALAERIPTAILNPDLVPGRANRQLGRYVDRIFAQWPGTAEYFPGVGGFRALGCPVRPGFLGLREELRRSGLARFGLQPQLRTLLTTGASQGARTINEAMVALAPELGQLGGWQVLHLSGPADVERVQAAYRAAGLRATVVAFTDAMPEAMAVADLAISRAGASTLAELTVMGLPSILMPYPFHRDEHQLRNARVLADAGAARIVPDRITTAENVAALRSTLLALARDASCLSAMAEAAKRLGQPHAARRISAELLDISHSRGAIRSAS
ncbi:MAG: UDP-N-acetylglucosamine--N-acetylmuramyl-(pentapeptide) pyrophosphoryl-undecaprenol N-acetylglucosamine transferase [Phycisphaerae bacterium]